MSEREWPVSPLDIADLWGKIEEMENDIEILKAKVIGQQERIELLLIIIRKIFSEEIK